jgi:hypothetical protein
MKAPRDWCPRVDRDWVDAASLDTYHGATERRSGDEPEQWRSLMEHRRLDWASGATAIQFKISQYRLSFPVG